MRRSRMIIRAVPTIVIVATLALGTVWAADGNLPAGTPISVEITAPPDGILVASPPGEITLEGTATVGEGVATPNTLIVYVLDVSYSTVSAPGGLNGCGGEQNGDGNADTILDCEIAAAVALNREAGEQGTVGEVGVAIYGEVGAWADVSAAEGEQKTTGPADDTPFRGAPNADAEEVLKTAFSYGNPEFEYEPLSSGGVKLFSRRNVGSRTNFAAGLEAAAQIVVSSTMTSKMIVFMSDGYATVGSKVKEVIVPSGVVIHAFAVGLDSSCTANDSGLGSLQDVADLGATGSSCVPVTKVEDLPEIVPRLIQPELSSVTLSIDGGAEIGLPTVPALPQEGPASVTFSHPLPGLEPSMWDFCVTAWGSDAGGVGSVPECVNVTVANITLEPATATNELGYPGQTHTVTATVAAGADGGIEGVQVQFEITSGPNAMGPEMAMTDANGQALFTYEAKQGLDGLGKDEIQACFTDDLLVQACDTAEKIWQDTTPPDAACEETTNPSGKNIPNSKNEDGFYMLTAVDLVDPNPMIYLLDTGSGTVFPPADVFHHGIKIKYTEAPGTSPRMKKMGSEKGQGNAIQWHILGNGDACVYATDAEGNGGPEDCVPCLVPPPPK